jgi:hypothetical protein
MSQSGEVMVVNAPFYHESLPGSLGGFFQILAFNPQA